MTSETVTVVLPLPPRYLSPNYETGSRGSRMRKWACAQKYKKQACEALQAQGLESLPWNKGIIHYAFFHAQKRSRDEANYIQSCKAAVDGLVKGGLLPDDSHEYLNTGRISFAIDKTAPRCELTVERVS